MSKSVLVIGLGRFGRYITKKFNELNDEVMAIDINEEKIHDIMPYVVDAKIANCRRMETLESIGVSNFDLCFVCIGTDFQSSLEITCLLKDLGAKKVISKASNGFHAKFLMRNGADEVVYPEKASAEKLATKYSSNHIIDYIEISDDVAIYEIPVVPSWVDKSIIELDIRKKHKINILAVKNGGKVKSLPDADYVFNANDQLVVMGEQDDVEKVLQKIKS
ncbi:MAG: TrkA family potassium uptake protein [Oscillospiraceae bacterium]|nr:TrkA family potassium uptake protein [Oscillospiraceae bacterium]